MPDHTDFNGDGRDDLFVTRSGSNEVKVWLADPDGSFTHNPLVHMIGSYAQGAGDFNGDGRDDVLWRYSDGHVLSNITTWQGQPDGTFLSNEAIANYPLEPVWHVQGVGDFNGDGRDDVLLRHDDGSVTNWLGQANGTFLSNHEVATYPLPATWDVDGIGDFNGDGRDDLLLRHEDGTVTEWLGQADGGFFSNHAVATYHRPDGWNFVGTGDFNGDGRDDVLLWHNTSILTEWLGQADGGFFSNHAVATYAIPVHPNGVSWVWAPNGTGDYNGDGRDDVLIRSTFEDDIINWLGQPNGGFYSNHAVADDFPPEEWDVLQWNVWDVWGSPG